MLEPEPCRKQDVLQYSDTDQAYMPQLISRLPSGTNSHWSCVRSSIRSGSVVGTNSDCTVSPLQERCCARLPDLASSQAWPTGLCITWHHRQSLRTRCTVTPRVEGLQSIAPLDGHSIASQTPVGTYSQCASSQDQHKITTRCTPESSTYRVLTACCSAPRGCNCRHLCGPGQAAAVQRSVHCSRTAIAAFRDSRLSLPASGRQLLCTLLGSRQASCWSCCIDMHAMHPTLVIVSATVSQPAFTAFHPCFAFTLSIHMLYLLLALTPCIRTRTLHLQDTLTVCTPFTNKCKPKPSFLHVAYTATPCSRVLSAIALHPYLCKFHISCC